ncbi:MAG TPA: hypothetical protein VFA43_03185 [Gemmatimonadaceae bacterium]|nr:hypothetical protein [Gemmatimonadaceae bacterium]
MSEDSRARAQAGLLLVLVYILGAATGGGLAYAIRQRPPQFHLQAPMGSGSGPVLRGLDALGLTDEQRQAIQRIVERSQPRTDSILNQTLPSLREEADSMQARIRAVLTPEQRRRFDAMPTVRAP